VTAFFERIAETPQVFDAARGADVLDGLKEAFAGTSDLAEARRLLSEAPKVRQLLGASFSGSPYLASLALRSPALLADCLLRDPDAHLAEARALLAKEVGRAASPKDAMAALRGFKRRIALLGISTMHFVRKRGPRGRKGTRWTDEELRKAVAAATSYAETIRAIGLIPAGGNYDQVKRRIVELRLDVSHFTGQRWNASGVFRPRPPRSLDEVLVAGRWTTTHNLKKRLLREGLKTAACELCGWCVRSPDGRIPVELDHINGDKTDNRLANLRILCPNCHALQPTHRGLNRHGVRRRS